MLPPYANALSPSLRECPLSPLPPNAMRHAAQVCFGLGKPPVQDSSPSSHGGVAACGGEPPPPSASQGSLPSDERSVPKAASRECSGGRQRSQREGDEPKEVQQQQQQQQRQQLGPQQPMTATCTWGGSSPKPLSQELEQRLSSLPLIGGSLVHTSAVLAPFAAHLVLLDGYVEMQELLGQGSVSPHLYDV